MDMPSERSRRGEPTGTGPEALVEGLARALGRPAGTIEFLPPEMGRALSGRFEQRRAALAAVPPAGAQEAVVPLVTSTRDRAVVEGVLVWLAGRVPAQEVVLLRPGSVECGGARATSAEVLLRALDLLGLDPGAEVRAISADAAFGLGLSVVGEGPGEEEETLYRLVSWGFRAGT